VANNFDITLPHPYTAKLGEGLYGAPVLELPTVDGIITVSTTITGAGTLPGLTASGSFQGGVGAMTLPVVTGSGTGTIANPLTGALILPLPTSTATGTMGGSTTAALTLPTLTASWTVGGTLRFDLPALQGSGIISVSLNLSALATLPRMVSAGVITAPVTGWLRGNAILPAVLGQSGSGVGNMFLPLPLSSGAIVAGTAATRQAWVMNVATGGITQFNNFPFRAFARAYGHYYGAHLDAGLYTMGGDKDAGAAISWEFHTGIADVGSRGIKGVLALYLDGVAERGCDFGVVLDTGTYWYSHSPHGTQNNHQTQRVPIGKALRSVNWGFMMRSTKGAYVEVDSITPEWQLSNRNL
jgi:hypothetical protein